MRIPKSILFALLVALLSANNNPVQAEETGECVSNSEGECINPDAVVEEPVVEEAVKVQKNAQEMVTEEATENNVEEEEATADTPATEEEATEEPPVEEEAAVPEEAVKEEATPAKKKRVVICGITGSQGAWTYQALKDDPELELVGFSRNVTAARDRLDDPDRVTLYQADLSDKTSLEKAFAGADYVFAVTQPWNKDYSKADIELEIQQGKNILEAAKAAKVHHLVYSGSDHFSGKTVAVPHVDSKIKIEELIKASGLEYTILRPVMFADNVGGTHFPVEHDWAHKLRGFVDGDAEVPYITCRDIGRIAAVVLKQPSQYAGQSIRLVGDLVSGDQLAAIVTKLRSKIRLTDPDTPGASKKREPAWRYYPGNYRFIMQLFAKEFYAMRVMFEELGRDEKQVAQARKGIEALKQMLPDLSTMEEHLKREGWASKVFFTEDEKMKKEHKARGRAQMNMWVAPVSFAMLVFMAVKMYVQYQMNKDGSAAPTKSEGKCPFSTR